MKNLKRQRRDRTARNASNYEVIYCVFFSLLQFLCVEFRHVGNLLEREF